MFLAQMNQILLKTVESAHHLNRFFERRKFHPFISKLIAQKVAKNGLFEKLTFGRLRANERPGGDPCAALVLDLLIVSVQVTFHHPSAIALAVFPGEKALLLEPHCHAFDGSE